MFASKNTETIYTNSILALAWNEYESHRAISSISKVADANFDGQSAVARFGGGYKFKLLDNLITSPNSSITFGYSRYSSYTEYGAGAANLAVKNDDNYILGGKLGLKTTYFYDDEDGNIYKPELRLAYGYDLINSNQNATNQFVGTGAKFRSEGIDNGKSSKNIGFGIEVISNKNLSMSIDYDYEGKLNYDSHSAGVKFIYRFE
jgi:outer membrane autotransporter protein